MAPRLDEHGIPGQLVLTAAQDLLANDTSVRAGLTRRRLVRLTELTVEVTDAQTTDPHDRAPAPMDLGFLMAASLRPSIDTIHMFDTTPHVKPGKAAPPTPEKPSGPLLRRCMTGCHPIRRRQGLRTC